MRHTKIFTKFPSCENFTVQLQSVPTMLPSKDLVAYFSLLWVFINGGECQNIEEMSKTLDQILVNTRSFRRPRDHEDASSIWQQYEFGTGVGNREGE